MRTTPLVGLALLFGCDPNYYGVEPDDTGADVDDTGGDTNVDSDDDTEDTEPVSDCHLADPLALTGWSRSYSVTWEGKTGTEVHTPMGEGYSSTATAAYIVQIALTTTDGDTLTTNDYRTCNAAGGADWLESQVNGQATLDLLGDFGGDFGDMAEIIALITQLFGTQGGTGNPMETTMPVAYRKLPTPGVPYLTDYAGLSSGSLIEYDYQLMTAGQTTDMFTMPNCASGANGADLDATCVGIDGVLQPLGLTSVTVPAGTFQAYRVVDDRWERWSESQAATGGLPDLSQFFPMPGGFFGNSEDQHLISELYYVPGIGLVQERTKYADAAPDDWLMIRSLTSFTGLTVAE